MLQLGEFLIFGVSFLSIKLERMAENVMESNDIIAPIADAVCDGRS